MKRIDKKTPYPKSKFTGIIIDHSEIDGEERIELICDNCRQTLVKLSDHGGNNQEWFCRNCSIPFYPDEKEIRRKKSLGTRQRAADMETYVTTTPGVNYDSVAIRHEPELLWGAKEMTRKGTIRFIHYEEGKG
jgi:hypothetical protein